MPQIKSVENQANITICLCTYLPIADSTVFFLNTLICMATKRALEECVGVNLGQY